MTLMLANGDPCGGTFDGFFQSFANLRHRSPPLKGRSPTHHRGRDMEAFGEQSTTSESCSRAS